MGFLSDAEGPRRALRLWRQFRLVYSYRFPLSGYGVRDDRFILSNPETLPTTGTMGSAFVGRKSFYDWGLPQGDLAEAIPNYKHVFVDLPAENQAVFPWWPGYQEWEQFWFKWTDPSSSRANPTSKRRCRVCTTRQTSSSPVNHR